MTIENLKQISIKYATTKGSCVPLAPDELCNAVVQYMNSFFGVMADINKIKVAVTEDSGNIVFTITGNTYDGKPITPIVITVDHNDFVTDQEFEEFNTSVTEQLNNKLNKITSPISKSVLYAHIEGNDRQISYNASPIPNTVLYRNAKGNTAVAKGVSDQDVANMENIADVKAKIPDVSGFATKSEVSKKLDKTGGTINGSLTVEGDINTSLYKSRGVEVIDIDLSNTRFNVGNARYGINILSSNRPTVTIGESISNIAGTSTEEMAYLSDIPAYTTVDSVSYDITNGAIIAYYGAHEIHIPLLAGDNVTINASEDNKKIVISAAVGGGAGGVTAAGNNTFTGENTFTNEITFHTMKSEAGGIQFGNFEGITENGYTYSGLNDYQFVMQKFVGTDDYYETVITADLITYKPAGNNNVYEFHFPNKSGTFAMTTDIIKDPIYFISFYANDLSNACHLIGTMMSKNSYGTGQKTNNEFAVMLVDNLYTNSNEGLAAYGKLAGKDILCIYSEDGLSIRCLDEENSEVDLPTVMFFVMETEL